MNLNIDTKLSELLKAYPWLIDEAVKLDERAKILNNPIGKMFVKKATIKDLSEKLGIRADEIIAYLQQMIQSHKA